MALRLGPKVKVQFKREAAYANGGYTSDHCIAVEDIAFESKPQMAESLNMPAAGASAQPWMVDGNQAGIVIANEITDGQMTTPLDYEGLLQFFDMIYGTSSFGTYGANVSAGPPYTHTFKEAEFLNSMQMEIVEGALEGVKLALLLGVKATGLTVSGKAVAGEGSLLKLAMNFVARKKQLAQTPTASLTTTVTRQPIRMADLSAFNYGLGGETPILRGFDFIVKPTLIDKQMQGGSAYIREPIRVGLIDTRLKLSLEYQSDTAMSTLIAGTTGTPGLTFSTGANAIFSIAFSKAKLMSVSQPRPTLNDTMVQDLEWKAMWNSNYGASVVFVNTQTGPNA